MAREQERPVFADEKRLLRRRSAARLARLFRQSGADEEAAVGYWRGKEPPTAAEEAASAADIAEKHVENDWRPERLFRTCLSSLEDSNAFGRMMETEADVRGFYHAAKKAFVGDGLPYNWTIQSDRFCDFTPILDFVHAVEHLDEASRSVHHDVERRWTDYLRWVGRWGGNILPVISELREHQRQVGLPPKDCEKTDPRKVCRRCWLLSKQRLTH